MVVAEEAVVAREAALTWRPAEEEVANPENLSSPPNQEAASVEKLKEQRSACTRSLPEEVEAKVPERITELPST